MDQTQEILALKRRLETAEGQIRDMLPKVEKNLTDLKSIPTLASVPVSNTPTANGYVPFFINGQRINLLTGS